MAEAYIHDGVAQRKAKELYLHDGIAQRKAKQVWVHDGIAQRLVYSSGAVVTPLLIDDLYAMLYNSSVSVQLTVKADGSITRREAAAFTDREWYVPIQPDVGAAYWARLRYISGDTTGGSFDTWLHIHNSPNWVMSAPAGYLKSGVFQLDISSTSDGSNIVATSNEFTMTADGAAF